MSETLTFPEHEIIEDDDENVLTIEPTKVILFNDEIHSFDEVIGQIIKATGYDYVKAEAITWEVHSRGKAVVYIGEILKCLSISSVLEEIRLMTHVEV
ncbi:MAG: ATP-dependent Clp protease adaptor ClpS [Bacteroidota bacterium]